MNSVIIRPAIKSDVNEVFDLGIKTKELSFSKNMKFHEKRELLEWLNNKKRNLFLVAEKDGKVMGYVYACIIDKDWCLIDNIAVHKKFRKEGIGTLLLKKVKGELLKRGVSYTNVLVEKNRDSSKRFWKRSGFSEGKSFVWYGEWVK